MHNLSRYQRLGSAARTCAAALALLGGGQALHAQGYGYPPAPRYERREASPVEQTIDHLRRIAERNTFSHRDHDRYENALNHLSQFADKLYRGQFDRGKLDRGIGDVQNVLQHNRMEPSARETLNYDLSQLYRLRTSNGYAYRGGLGYRY